MPIIGKYKLMYFVKCCYLTSVFCVQQNWSFWYKKYEILFPRFARRTETIFFYDSAKECKTPRAVKHQEKRFEGTKNTLKIIPESVNYHFTRTCNYSCGFCFHTAKTSFNVPLEQSKLGLEMLVNEGMKKVTILVQFRLKSSYYTYYL